MTQILIRLLAWIQGRLWLRYFGVREARLHAFREPRWHALVSSETPVTWFHASSLGELEMLTPLIEDFYARGFKVGVSAFSDSALPGLQKLTGITVYSGLSPRESEWESLFRHFKVERLILSKYDFWPGLMDAAYGLKIPVIVINAAPRGSLRIWKGISSGRIPGFHFFTNDIFSGTGLHKIFPDAILHNGVDPRYERVARRLESPHHPRLQFWKERVLQLPEPRGLLGSGWLEDLESLLPAFEQIQGTLIVVPHDLSLPNLERMQSLLSERIRGRFLLVNEMGILTELYSLVDWAFVGGGFGKGIHSTIEPAMSGIPVACGPGGVGRFPETKELREMGLLQCCQDTKEISQWLASVRERSKTKGDLTPKRVRYQALLEECLRIL